MNKETNKWEEEFKENFIGHIKHISVGQYDEGGVNIGFLSAEEVIIKFIKNLLKQQKHSLCAEHEKIRREGVAKLYKTLNKCIDDRDTAYQEGLKDGENTLMDVSKWKNMGKEKGYWEYFEKQIVEKIDGIDFYGWNEDTQRIIKDKILKELK